MKALNLFFLLFLLISCQKEETIDQQEIQETETIGLKNGITLAPIFFSKNGTTTNVKVSTDYEYESFNYSFVDTILFKQVSPSFALVGYSNTESQKMANYDVHLKFKGAIVEILYGYLSEYNGSSYIHIPNKNDDMFHNTNQNSKKIYTQTDLSKEFYCSFLDKKIDIFEWEIHLLDKGKCSGEYKEFMHPVRVGDWNFTLLNNHK